MAKFDSAARPNLAAAIAGKTLTAYDLVEIILDPTDDDLKFRLTNAPFDIQHQGNDYTAVGAVLNFGQIEESQEFGITEVVISLVGLPLHDLPDPDDADSSVNLVEQFIAQQFIDKDVRIFRAYFDKNDQLIDDSGTKGIIEMFSGRIDSPAVEESENDSTIIALKVTSHWVDFERRGGRRTNDNEQQNMKRYDSSGTVIGNFSGDRIFEFAYDSIKDIKWKT